MNLFEDHKAALLRDQIKLESREDLEKICLVFLSVYPIVERIPFYGDLINRFLIDVEAREVVIEFAKRMENAISRTNELDRLERERN